MGCSFPFVKPIALNRLHCSYHAFLSIDALAVSDLQVPSVSRHPCAATSLRSSSRKAFCSPFCSDLGTIVVSRFCNVAKINVKSSTVVRYPGTVVYASCIKRVPHPRLSQTFVTIDIVNSFSAGSFAENKFQNLASPRHNVTS